MAFESKFGMDLSDHLGLFHYKSNEFHFYQYITYMFMHANISHLFFNMFAFWMFGNVLENVWGSKRFLFYFFVTGIGAALIQFLVAYIRIQSVLPDLSMEQINIVMNEGFNVLRMHKNYSDPSMATLNDIMNTPMVGASGAVFGVLLAFGMLFPNTMLYVFFAIPIKAKYFVMIYGAIELYSGIANNPNDNVAHFAHLGGMLFGYFLIVYWRKEK